MELATLSATGWAAIGGLAFAVLSGGLAMAWRMGRLEQKVTDLATQFAADRQERVTERRRAQGLPERRGRSSVPVVGRRRQTDAG